MNIGIVTNWSYSGATEVSITFGEVLGEKHNISYYARYEEYSTRANQNSFNVTEGKFSGLPFPKAIDKRDFKKWIVRNDIQIILFNEQIWLEPVIWARDLEILTVGYIDYYNEVSIPHFRVFDALISNTKRHSRAFSWHTNIWNLPWGMDLSKMIGAPKDFSNFVKTDFFHSAGSSPIRRGTDLLLETMSHLENETLTIHSSKPLRELLPSHSVIIDLLEKQKKLQLIEKVEPLPGYYRLGKVYVYPNRLDGIGLTVIEALASGLPVICPDEEPMTDFVSDKVGYLIPVIRRWARRDGYYWPLHEVSVENLKRTMQQSLEDTSDLERRSEFARSSVSENHNRLKNYSELPRLFQELQKFDLSDEVRLSILRSKENVGFYLSNRYIRILIQRVSTFRKRFLNFVEN